MLRILIRPASSKSRMKLAVAWMSIAEGATGIRMQSVRASISCSSSGSPRGRIDDELARVIRDMHLDAAQPVAFLRRRIGGMDPVVQCIAQAQPVQARSLRIVVHHRNRNRFGSEIAG